MERGWGEWLAQGLLVLAILPVIGYGLPLSDLLRRIGLYGNFGGLVLAYTAAELPLALWLMRSYLVKIPHSLEEAAYLEGASWGSVLVRLVLPMIAGGGLAATAVLVFVLDWNLFLLPELLTEHAPLVLALAMRDFFEFERELEWTTAAATLLITLLPAFIVIFISQRALDRFSLLPQELPE